VVTSGGLSVTVSCGGLRGVDGGTFVCDISDETVVVVGGVGSGLDPAVGKGDHIRSLDITGGILGLGLLEVSLGVVVIDAILVCERLGSKLLLFVGSRCTVGSGRASGESHGEESGSDNELKIIG